MRRPELWPLFLATTLVIMGIVTIALYLPSTLEGSGRDIATIVVRGFGSILIGLFVLILGLLEMRKNRRKDY